MERKQKLLVAPSRSVNKNDYLLLDTQVYTNTSCSLARSGKQKAAIASGHLQAVTLFHAPSSASLIYLQRVIVLSRL